MLSARANSAKNPRLIANANLTVGDIRSSFDPRKVRNSIIRQEPLAGFSIKLNTPVHLVINRPSGEADNERLHRPLYGSLLRHRINSGYLKKRVRVELENLESTTDIFEDYVRPGNDIWILIPRDHDAAVFIYEDDELVKTRLYEAW